MAQQSYAYLITYQAVRQLMHHTAVAADLDPDRLSFTRSLEDQQEPRDRASPRFVERSPSLYPSKKHAAQPTCTIVDYTVEVLDPGPRMTLSDAYLPALRLRSEAARRTTAKARSGWSGSVRGAPWRSTRYRAGPRTTISGLGSPLVTESTSP